MEAGIKYTVKQGDCIESIAHKSGHFWETLWQHGDNAALKQKRQNPNVLLPGDIVYIPEKHPKKKSCATDRRHRFKRKGVPSKLRLVFKDEEDKPRAGLAYTLEIDGESFSGRTDAQGRLEHPIPPNARRGKLVLGTAENREEHELQLGHIDPVSEISGVQARLNNLGFDAGAINGKFGPQTKKALKEFRAQFKLTATGESDEATQEKLKEQHGS
ncbi:peptidoglycan-binding protein [Acidobacteriota bacterium]